jgi:hypothetical protein
VLGVAFLPSRFAGALKAVVVDRLRLNLTPRDFHEHSHVNYRGAQKYTDGLSAVVRSELRKRERASSR